MRPLKHHIVINHLEQLNGLCTKTGLTKSLRRFYTHNVDAMLGHCNVYDCTPTTYVVASHCQDGEFMSFVQRFRELQLQAQAPSGQCCTKERVPAKHCKENMWIVKPAAENQG